MPHYVRPARFFDFESWQAWEIHMPRELALPVVTIAIDDGEQRPDGSGNDGGTVRCRRQSLKRDIAELVLPKLHALERQLPPVRGLLPLLLAFFASQFALRSALVLTVMRFRRFSQCALSEDHARASPIGGHDHAIVQMAHP
jgi:hypothetical protein